MKCEDCIEAKKCCGELFEDGQCCGFGIEMVIPCPQCAIDAYQREQEAA